MSDTMTFMRPFFGPALLLAVLLLPGCENSSLLRPEPGLPTVPQVADSPDTTFTVAGKRAWFLVGNDLTPGQDSLVVTVATPPSVAQVHAFVDTAYAGTWDIAGDTALLQVDIGDLPVGSYELRLSADSTATTFDVVQFNRSCPLYVIVSNDWDQVDDTTGRFDEGLANADTLHAHFPGLALTHMVGPYAFTDPLVSAARRERFITRLIGWKAEHGDEVGLHIHPVCHFVATAGLDCRIEPVGGTSSLQPGFLTPCYAYPPNEFGAFLDAADSIFVTNALGRPTSFRAGGWWADRYTVQTLADRGFAVDGSGVNFRRLFGDDTTGSGVVDNFEWFKETWGTMGDTSQPYRPAMARVDVHAVPAMDILEVPNNGAMAVYLTADDMIQVFEVNRGTGPLASPRVVSLGYHPYNLTGDVLERMETVLDHVFEHGASSGTGPVVFARMSDLARVW